MKTICEKDLVGITGGASKNILWFVLGGAITFVIGFIDGIVNPIRCRNK